MTHRTPFVIAVAIYVLLRICSSLIPDLAASPVRLYGTDFLAPLVLIPLFTWMQVAFGLRSRHRPIAALEILIYVALMSGIYEWLLPHWTVRTVADPRDILAYAAGGITLWVWHSVTSAPIHAEVLP